MTESSPGGVDVAPRPSSGTAGQRPRWSTVLVVAAVAIALLLVGATLGIALGNRTGAASSTPAGDSVDAGFARDMIVHHDQGVLMSHYAEQHTTDNEIAVLAYDIGYTQTTQLGQMQGWLALWDLPEFSSAPRMAWMTDGGHGHQSVSGADSAAAAADGALMPGMATTAELARLRELRGEESDIYFLQLMIRHHQGGAPMMADAAAHAQNPVVRNFAEKMAIAQDAEISVMTQLLAARGAEPLPA